jgi:hypothetical protein
VAANADSDAGLSLSRNSKLGNPARDNADCDWVEWVLKPVDPGELPPGHQGPLPKVKELEVVGRTDGAGAIAVKKGQYILIRVAYASGNVAGTFNATLVIQLGATSEVPLSLFIADVRTTFIITPLLIQQGQHIDLPVSVKSVAGPGVDVSYKMSPLQLHTGITLAPVSVHLNTNEEKQIKLTFQAAPDAPLGPNTLFVDQIAFRPMGILLPVNIAPAVASGPGHNREGPFCVFADPPGSIGVAPRAYGLKDGLPRKSQLTYALTGALPTPSGQQPIGFFAGVIALAFQTWAVAAPSINATLASPGNVDITIGSAVLNTSPTGTKAGNTNQEGSQIQFDTANFLWRPNQASVLAGDPGNTVSLLAIAIHEIGHALGLLHSTNPAAVMSPFGGNLEALNPEDSAAIKALYGWAPQSVVTGAVGTETGPALCGCDGTLVLAWRGIGDDFNIRFAISSNGKSWSDPQLVPGAASSGSPSLAWNGNLLWMAWKGVPGDQGVYYATWNLKDSWNVVSSPISGVGSSHGPSIAIAGTPILVWKGIAGDSGIYFSKFSSPGGWGGQNNIGGVGTSDSPAVGADPVTGVPRMVWKGVAGDDALYTSTLRGPFWQPQQDVAWVVVGNAAAGTITVGRPGSNFGPSIVTAFGQMLMAWRGVGDDQDIYFTQAAPDPAIAGQSIAEWSTQAKVGSVATSDRPTIASLKGNTYIAWKGIAGDHNIYTTFV